MGTGSPCRVCVLTLVVCFDFASAHEGIWVNAPLAEGDEGKEGKERGEGDRGKGRGEEIKEEKSRGGREAGMCSSVHSAPVFVALCDFFFFFCLTAGVVFASAGSGCDLLYAAFSPSFLPHIFPKSVLG